MIFAAALGVALAAAVLFVVELLSSYPSLPEKVPLHFDWAGRPGQYGPRWALPALLGLVELSLIAGFLAPSPLRHSVGPTYATPVILATSAVFITYMQHLMYRVALGKDARLGRSFWIAFVTVFAACIGVANVAR